MVPYCIHKMAVQKKSWHTSMPYMYNLPISVNVSVIFYFPFLLFCYHYIRSFPFNVLSLQIQFLCNNFLLLSFSLISPLKNCAENYRPTRPNTAFSAWEHLRVLVPFLEPWIIWLSPQHSMVKVISRASPILILDWICVAFMLTSANHHHLILMERIMQIIIINQNIFI